MSEETPSSKNNASRFSERRSESRDRRVNQADRRSTERVGVSADRRARSNRQKSEED